MLFLRSYHCGGCRQHWLRYFFSQHPVHGSEQVDHPGVSQCLFYRVGLAAARDGDVDPAHFDEGKIAAAFQMYGPILQGLKLRTSRAVVKELGYAPLRRTLELAGKLGVSVMVHCTDPPGEMDELLSILRPGDVLTHMYMNKGSTILDGKGTVSKAAYDARKRGVLFEAADARAHFSFEVGESAIRQGISSRFHCH